MPKSHANRTEPWADFTKESDRIFDENFVKDKIFTFKTAHHSPKGIIKFKQMVQKKDHHYEMDEQIKVWFPVGTEGSNFFSEIRKTEWKIRYDHGLRSYSNNLINFYGCFHVSPNFNNLVGKIGANLVGVNTNFDNRVRVIYNDKKVELSSDHKISWVNNKWSLDVYHLVNYTKASLCRNAFRFIYFIDPNSQFYVKTDNKTERVAKHLNFSSLGTYFTHLIFDYVRRIDSSTKVGLEACVEPRNFKNASVVAEKYIKDSNYRFKVKLSTDKVASLSLESKIIDYGRWVLGWEVSDIGNKNTSKYGLLVEVNV